MEISSPRPSVNPPTPSSTRSSLSIDRPSRLAAGQPPRRNRSALRDYYNLQTTAFDTSSPQPASSTASPRLASAQDPTSPTSPTSPTDPFDSPDFNAQTYIEGLLATADLATVLKASTGLVSKIRGLDGERKALVYDNYSKLIAATETIRKMRGNMDPLAPMTEGLGAGVGDIVQQAEAVQQMILKDAGHSGATADHTGEGQDGNTDAPRVQQKKQIRTVRWALDAPGRLEGLIKDGKKDEAEREWEVVKRLLGSWTGVKGVEELRERGDKILGID